MDTIHLELTDDEVLALAHAILSRMQQLASMPQSPEYYEMRALSSIVRKTMPQAQQNIEQIGRMLRDQQN